MLDNVPCFHAPISLQSKSVIGKPDELRSMIDAVYIVEMGGCIIASRHETATDSTMWGTIHVQ